MATWPSSILNNTRGLLKGFSGWFEVYFLAWRDSFTVLSAVVVLYDICAKDLQWIQFLSLVLIFY